MDDSSYLYECFVMNVYLFSIYFNTLNKKFEHSKDTTIYTPVNRNMMKCDSNRAGAARLLLLLVLRLINIRVTSRLFSAHNAPRAPQVARGALSPHWRLHAAFPGNRIGHVGDASSVSESISSCFFLFFRKSWLTTRIFWKKSGWLHKKLKHYFALERVYLGEYMIFFNGKTCNDLNLS